MTKIKTVDDTLKSGTHFEQIPLEEVVKKMAEGLTLEPSSMKTEPYSMPTGSLNVSDPTRDPIEGRSRRETCVDRSL